MARRHVVSLVSGLALAACAVVAAPEVTALRDGPVPYTHADYDDRDEDFSFAIISDLTGSERAGIFQVAVADLNLLRPAFVMSVGDLIQGYTEDEVEIFRQWDAFDAKVAPLVPPFFYVPGNHDISNPTMRAAWEQRLGPRYYHFVYKDVLFIALDSEDYDPALGEAAFENPVLVPADKKVEQAEVTARRGEDPAVYRDWVASLAWDGTMDGDLSDAQVAYVEDVLAANPDVRWTFLFLHKPLWQGEGSTAFGRIEAALGDRPYAVFAGHTHNYEHFESGRQIYIRLGTTGGGWVHEDEQDNFDHVVMVSMTADGPSIANLRLDGVLDETGKIPAGGEDLCFAEETCRARGEQP